MTPEQRAAMKQALEVLQELDGIDTETECVTIDVGNVIAALIAALEQPAQQEPVARVVGYYAGRCVIEPLNPAAVMPDNMALYTRPQARQWVGLTESEIIMCSSMSVLRFYDAIEAKLREKNT